MSDQNNTTEDSEDECCLNCTTRGCDTPAGCDFQTDFDKSMGIYSYRDIPMDFAMTNEERVRKGLPPIEGNGPVPSDLFKESLPVLPVPEPEKVPDSARAPESASVPEPARDPEPEMAPVSEKVGSLPVDQLLAKRKPGRPPSGTLKEIVPKKPSGGQLGNLNALKHGLYVQGNALYHTSPLERTQLFNLQTAVNQYKNYINKTYEEGLKLTDIDKINETMRTLSVAAIALTRLLAVHDQADPIYLPFNKRSRTSHSLQKLTDFYNNKIASFMGTEEASSEIVTE